MRIRFRQSSMEHRLAATALALTCAAVLACPAKADWLPALSPSTPVDTSSGFGVATGAVSTGHSVFRFNAYAGNTITIEVVVTEVLAGSESTDDDSQLYLFSSTGKLYAQNDDFGDSFESKLEDFVVPISDTWFAVVTTFDNQPIFDSNATISDWTDGGGSNIKFNLLISGVANVPEPGSCILFSVGIIVCLAFITTWRNSAFAGLR